MDYHRVSLAERPELLEPAVELHAVGWPEFMHPMADAVVDQVDGRMVRIGDHWLADFASCNYLGLDPDAEVLCGVPDYLARWGSHPSWARGIASPALYEQVETEVVELLGVKDALALPTLTHIHNGVLPALAGEGTLLIDTRAHRPCTTPP